MSGYGVPQGPTPGSPRSGRAASALPVLELVGVGLAALAFIIAFVPWATPDVPAGVDADPPSVSGWELPLPTVGVTLLLVAALLIAARLLTRRAAGAATDADDRPASPVPALLAVLGAVLLLVFAIIGGDYLGTDLSRDLGTWLGLLLGLGTAAVLLLSWLQRSGRMTKRSPAAGAPGWGAGQTGQPQGWGQQQPPQYGQPAQQPSYGQQAAPQPSAYGQQPSYGAPAGYPGPVTGGQPAQQPGPYGQEPYGQDQYPPQSGGYPAQGGYHPQG